MKQGNSRKDNKGIA